MWLPPIIENISDKLLHVLTTVPLENLQIAGKKIFPLSKGRNSLEGGIVDMVIPISKIAIILNFKLVLYLRC